MNEPLLIRDLELRVLCGGISRTTLNRWTASGLIPKPTKINHQNFRSLAEVKAALIALGLEACIHDA